jgi:hypothetical protein
MSIQESLALALKDAELTDFSAWQDLDALSARTQIEQIDLLEDQVRVDGDRIEGPINVFVTLHYGDRADSFEETEEFPGRLKAHLEGDRVVIDDISVDVRSFFE